MTDVPIPQIGESITHAFVSRWIAQKGDRVEAGDNLLEIDTDKASMEVPSPVSGTLVELLAEEGDEIAIGAVFARIDESGSSAASEDGDSGGSDGTDSDDDDGATASPEMEASTDKTPNETDDGDAKRAGPAARRGASEAGVDINTVSGTGPRGRVTSADVKSAGSGGSSKGSSSATPAPSAPIDNSVRTERVAMTPLRRTIARRLVEAQQTAAMLTTFNEVDMSRVMDVRKQYQERFVARYDIKLGFMSFFLKAAIEGLKEFPAVNAEIDGTDIVYKNYYNIGIAVSGKKGLVVPVLRDADQLSFAGIEHGIKDLAGKARSNKLRLDDFKDGTFTITNGGIFGSMMSTPILNAPQVGILGMHNIVERPVVVDGEIVIRPMMYLALSYDHRIIDGKEAVSFLVRIKECIENPERMLFEV